jgi:hypothetical protein
MFIIGKEEGLRIILIVEEGTRTPLHQRRRRWK